MLAISPESGSFSTMSLRKLILSRLSRPSKCAVVRRCRQLALLWLPFLAVSLCAAAKDVSLTAIVLFDGPEGAAYVQVNGIALNGKSELRICDGVAKISKRNYDTLLRTQISTGASLERRSDGTLSLIQDNKSTCVVPANLKFDKSPELTPGEAAEQTTLQGLVVSSSTPGLTIPAIKPGVQLVFLPAPDPELGEYLRARRAGSAAAWEDFLARHPASARTADARNALAEVHEHLADGAFSDYQKLAAAHKPDLGLLKQAYAEARAAGQADSGYRPAFKLQDAISQELDALLEQDRTELHAFGDALKNHTTGYSHLTAAKRHIERLLEIRPDYAPVLNLQGEIAKEDSKCEATLKNAETLLAAQRYDEAVAALGPDSAFATEIPRMDAVLAAAYGYHSKRGQELAGRQDWEQASAEFRKAAAIRSDSPEANASLNNALQQMNASRNRQAADQALLESKAYASSGDFIAAYNRLATLPEPQRALVANQLAALTPDYVTAASRRGLKLQEAHLPIRGRADEDAVREAYDLLERASSLTGDPAVKLKHDFLAGKISAYYIEQARKYFEKPLGSGVGVGWLYLMEAQRYDTNLGVAKDQLKDLTTTYAPVYRRRARLSVGIVIRDQTSRRNSAGFADQIADAIANGLEPAGPVEIVRRPGETPGPTQPNFMLVGEILEHRVVKNASLETLQSKYRAGTHEVKNPVWLQANTDLEAARQQLVAAQSALAEAQAQHKKKEIVAAASDAVKESQDRCDQLRHTLETTDQNRVEAVIEPYQYTRKTVELSGSIDVAFRINDQSGNSNEPAVAVHKENHKSVAVLENVKPEDTEGVANKSVEPDEGQFLTDLEIETRNALVKAVREKASLLSTKIFAEAHSRAQRGDVAGAAEEYVLYLNATPAAASPERDEAVKFLRDQFNLARL
jgi:hypothetical protein